jgi:hypothetical protein
MFTEICRPSSPKQITNPANTERNQLRNRSAIKQSQNYVAISLILHLRGLYPWSKGNLLAHDKDEGALKHQYGIRFVGSGIATFFVLTLDSDSTYSPAQIVLTDELAFNHSAQRLAQIRGRFHCIT